MKKLLYGILAAIFALLLLVLIVPNFIDWSHYKQPIISAVKNHTGFELDLKGPVHLQIFPMPHLSATDVTIKNKPDGQAENLIELKSLSLNAEFMPLLFGEIIIGQIELIHPLIFLETLKNGQNNWDMKPSSSLPSGQPSSDSTQIKMEGESKKLVFSLKKIKIKDGFIGFSDFQKNSHQEMKDINLEGSMESLTGPFAIKGSLEINHYILKGEVNTGELSAHEQSPLTANLSVTKDGQEYGQMDIKGTVLDKKFIGNVKSDTLKIPFSLNLEHQKIDFQKGMQISAEIEASPESVKVSNLDLQLDTLKIMGNAYYKAPQIECKFTLTEGNSEIDLSAIGQSSDKHLWEGLINVKSNNPQVFLGWSGLDAPYLKGVFNISTNVSVDGNSYALSSLKFKVGALEGSGKATLNLDPKLIRPYFNADLSINTLNVNAYLSNAPSAKPLSTPASHQKSENSLKSSPSNTLHSSPAPSVAPTRWSKNPWNFTFLKMIDTDFTFNIGKLDYDHYQLQKVSGKLHIKDGNLQLNSFQAFIYEGKLNADVTIHQGGPSPIFKLVGTIHDINVGSIPQIKQSLLKKATLNTTLHLTAKGHNLWESINTLSGDAKLNLTHGVIEAFNVHKLVTEIKHIRTPVDIANLVAGTQKKSETPFTHVKAEFMIQDGNATSKNVEFLSEEIQMNANGVINFPQWTLNMNAQIKIKDLWKMPPFGMTIEGSLDSPSYNIDADFLAKILLSGAADIVLDTAAGIGGTVGGVINGLLGGDDTSSPQQTSSKKKPDTSIKPEKFIKNLLGL